MSVGNIYFAMVDQGTAFNPSVHNVEDEEVFNLKIAQSEGSFAVANVEIKNPSKGLLSPTRKRHVLISYQDGASVTLLFSGRVTGYPDNIGGDTISLEFIAQPDDWEVQQGVFLQTLKTAPEYNSLFIEPSRRDDPAEILAGRSELLHWSRDTQQISTSDILQGSQTVDLGSSIFFDTISTDIGDPPLSKVNLDIEVQWDQIGVGTVDAGKAITDQFTNSVFSNPHINTLTPLAFEDGWRGVRIPTGYTVQESKLVPEADGFGSDQLVMTNLRSPTAVVSAADFPRKTGDTSGTREVTVPRVWYNGTLSLQAEYQQKRREVVSMTVVADTQEFSLKGNKQEDISTRLQNPTEIDQSQVHNPKLPSFFYDKVLADLTVEGRSVIEHGVKRAMARLKKASRVIETSFEVDLESAIALTLDHSVKIQDSRIPGGVLLGKVIDYVFEVDGDSGSQIAKITIGSSIGKGISSSGSGVQIGSVQYDNEFGTPTMDSSVFYDLTATPIISEPIDVLQMESDDQYLITSATVTNGGESQVLSFDNDPPNSRPDLQLETGTGVVVDLRTLNPLAEIFTQISITTHPFGLPKQANLEAS